MNNKLYRKHPETGESMGGFFEFTRRVRAQKFLKVKSEGIWLPLIALTWTGIDTNALSAGTQMSEANGHLICQKYYNQATKRTMTSFTKQKKKTLYTNMFKQHFDTEQLRYNLRSIPVGAICTISEKIHGTSGRTGRVLFERRETWIERILNPILGLLNRRVSSSFWNYISGTRRVDLDPETVQDNGFYSGKQFRLNIHNQIKTVGLHQGETLFYEIVGYMEDGGLIMPTHTFDDKEIQKQYGTKTMVYKYGCQSKESHIYVYRITYTNAEGISYEVPNSRLVSRCKELGLNTVPVLDTFIFDGNKEALLERCKQHSEGSSTLDSSHIREGICLRVESPELNTIYKYKSYYFCFGEGIKSNDEYFVDPEDVS
jgi:hypothetical protein